MIYIYIMIRRHNINSIDVASIFGFAVLRMDFQKAWPIAEAGPNPYGRVGGKRADRGRGGRVSWTARCGGGNI